MSAVPLASEPPLAVVMAAPPWPARVVGSAPLDLITDRTSPEKRCQNSFALCGLNGTWAVLVNAPCGRWSCEACGERKARRYAGIARAGCDMAGERLRLLTITMKRETPADSWSALPGRWGKFYDRLTYQLRRRPTYFGTVELQKRGNPHLHLLMRDTGFIPKAMLAQACTAVGFGFADIRQIAPGAGVQYVTKYLHKSAGQVMPKGARRIRRSRDWYKEPPEIVSRWGDEWQWQSVEGLDPEYVDRQLAAAGVLQVFRYEGRVEPSSTD
jgi:hypothetical protein